MECVLFRIKKKISSGKYGFFNFIQKGHGFFKDFFQGPLKTNERGFKKS